MIICRRQRRRIERCYRCTLFAIIFLQRGLPAIAAGLLVSNRYEYYIIKYTIWLFRRAFSRVFQSCILVPRFLVPRFPTLHF